MGARSRGQQIRSGAKWQAVCTWARDNLPAWCTYENCNNPNGRHIDLTLDHRDRWSWTLDHIIELEDNGDPYDHANVTPMHRSCNSTKAGYRAAARRRARIRARAHDLELRTLATLHPREGGTPPTETSTHLDPALSTRSLSESRSDPGEWCPRAS